MSHRANSTGTDEDLVNYASHTEREVLGVVNVAAGEKLAAALECKSATTWTEMDTEGTPLCWNDAYLETEDWQARSKWRQECLQSETVVEAFLSQKVAHSRIPVERVDVFGGVLIAPPDQPAGKFLSTILQVHVFAAEWAAPRVSDQADYPNRLSII
ncbi:hypothetical protein [Cupriavidus taiwanensis]|uniref:hypothetical protein n=1 Tax=Cupriavidus taiwanensis TaxID=164546 RepID=UPI0011C05481|nr:hypothetical protein [Cupriavidus taiwanensis]